MMTDRVYPPLRESVSENRTLRFDDLFEPFAASFKPRSEFRIGIEAERFGADVRTLEPIGYDGPQGILGLFNEFVNRFGWVPYSERPDGPIIALKRGEAAITLEPAGQLEFSGAPWRNVHDVEAERRRYVAELDQISAEKNLVWMASGFHPFARHDQLPWVPKMRYGVMRSYLASRGADALEMMRRTATVQANFDYSDERDALRKLRVGLRLSPIVNAMFANAPLVEGRLYGGRSRRLQVWLNVDPDRQGLLPQMWSPTATLNEYVEWALDAPMFMFLRGGQAIHNAGQSFRSFFSEGFEGYRATMQDWHTHLNTLFPEVRLKQTIEVRGADSVPSAYLPALPALWTGVLYDDQSLAEAEALSAFWTYEEMSAMREHLAHEGLSAAFRGAPAAKVADRVLQIAADGLGRRGQLDDAGRDESKHLDALVSLVASGRTPADELMGKLGDAPLDLHRIVSLTQA